MFQRTSIDLVGDRTGGQKFPQIRGVFLLVDKCDIPCEISIDGSFYFSAREGLDLRGPFDEIYVRHPNYVMGSEYTGFNAGLPSLRLITSVDSAINNYFSDQYFPSGLPFNVIGAIITAPIFGNVRYIRPNFCLQLSNISLLDFDAGTFRSSGPRLECRFYRSYAQSVAFKSIGGMDIADTNHFGTYDFFTHSGNNGNIINIGGRYQVFKLNGLNTFVGTAIFDGDFEIPVPNGANFVDFELKDDTFSSFTMTDFSDGSPVSTGTIFAK